MASFYFHLRDSVDVLLDPDGMECADLDTLVSETLRMARDVIAGDVRSGEIDLHYHIDVEDDAGTVVHSLSFADAVTIKQLAA